MTTLRDIAQRAGVSAMTVSNVINGRHRKVSQETIERVRAIIDELGFEPEASARVLKSRRSKIIALIYPSEPEPLANQHDAAFVGAVEREVSGRERHLMVWSAKDVAWTAANLRSWRVDGAICYGTVGGEVDELNERVGVPIVFVDNYSRSPEVRRVGVDDYRGGLLAARHLLDAGHRTLGFVGPLQHDVGVVRERYRGFRAAIDAAGEPADEVRFERNPRFEDGRRLAIELSTTPDRPTGLFATADILAVGLLNGFRRTGVDVPGQVSLIGFDDIPEAGHVLPELTTIRQDVGEKARVAVESLLGLMEPDADPGVDVRLTVELIQRSTVGPPPLRQHER